MIDPTVNIPSKQSSDIQWIQFYTDMENILGKKKAEQLFVAFWNQRGSSKANTGKLYNFLKEKGIEFNPSLQAKVGSKAIDLVDRVGDVFAAGKKITILLAIVLAGAIGIMLINVIKNPEKAVGMASKAKGLKALL